ncbi:MAG: polyribonucleotide nucleotidyltransferase [Elusimicrobia bacterium RIFOXYC2_FULL_34_12]|nr:MAG: polyribonucleotide nucleotidyltransferase [Elusimicrobia bacterium RIFOXYC2_FULL_34_12]OGS38644.1 MAG: polyribonucleotide nucleotidyltransferase [Elusimicrobia bacterium RIFOXYD2_FULL_34_30]HAM39479.1 polyribonucleotide nucleotidyltransferase [Elusimicrobiota bacterium]
MNEIRIDIEGKPLIIKTGELAKQSSGAVTVQYGETVILATANANLTPQEPKYFLPLTVDYRERTYAAGKIPGGFFKREGRPREKEILTSRMVDRTIRPLFPENYFCETQVGVTLLSSDIQNDSDVLSVIGVSAALLQSGVPYFIPVAAVRVGRIDGKFVINPTFSDREKSDVDLFISATEKGIVMLEGGPNEIDEKTIIDAIKFGLGFIPELINKQKEFINPNKAAFKAPIIDETVKNEITKNYKEKINDAVRIHERKERELKINEIMVQAKLNFPEKENDVENVIEELIQKEARNMIVNLGVRSDGRKPDEIRNIDCKIGVLPRTHGSAVFTRGQTQALATTTLGTPQDMQIMDELEGEYKKRFMLHYNFPSFAVGEVKPERGPGRREIGHGALAEKSLEKVLPSEENFPYAIRIVSDILESNGSSSMATVCGGSLALMDAGIPIKSGVAGIAMGLMTEGDKYVILTDIQGLEDHYGDMDFKVAGTRVGITGIQMDIKIDSVKMNILEEGLEKAKIARLKILDIMDKTISQSKSALSEYAPKMITIMIDVAKIKDVIGSGGKIIRKIIQDTGAEINIEDDGKITISAVNSESLNMAKQRIEDITADVEVGKIYKGKVVSITNFGAFVEVLPNKDGLVHISQIEEKRVEKVEDVLKLGDEIWVKVMEVDKQGRINLSRKQAMKEMEKK